MTRPAVIERMSPRQGKVLRFVVGTRDQPVAPSKCIVGIWWSDLPKTDLQARKALSVLTRLGLVKRIDKDAYEATEAGREVIAVADKEGLWRTPPPPDKTNKFLHTEKKGKRKK